MSAEAVDTADDPFERAVRRERMLRRVGSTQRDALRMVKIWMVALNGAWAVILIGHWVLFRDPRWLVVLHTVLFALTATMALIAGLAQSHLARRINPELFDD